MLSRYTAPSEFDDVLGRTPPDVTDLVVHAVTRFLAEDPAHRDVSVTVETELDALAVVLRAALDTADLALGNGASCTFDACDMSDAETDEEPPDHDDMSDIPMPWELADDEKHRSPI